MSLEMEKEEELSAIGILNEDGLPALSKVYHVNMLCLNLISINQLCDENHFVNFTKDTCEVHDTNQQFFMQGRCFMQGRRTKNNCYILTQSN